MIELQLTNVTDINGVEVLNFCVFSHGLQYYNNLFEYLCLKLKRKLCVLHDNFIVYVQMCKCSEQIFSCTKPRKMKIIARKKSFVT